MVRPIPFFNIVFITNELKQYVDAVFILTVSKAEDGSVYNPYRRDIVVTGLSMTCRGEFSFIIAAFALSEGVIDPDTYAAVVLAVLVSAITSPFLLMKSITYFKACQEKHLKEEIRKTSSSDGKMPLFYHIHLEMKGSWSLLQRLRNDIESLGLQIKDFRTQHVRGYDPVIYYDIFVRDTKHSLKLETIEEEHKILSLGDNTQLKRKISDRGSISGIVGVSDAEMELLAIAAEKMSEEDKIDSRADEIESCLKEKLSNFKSNNITMDVTQWKPWDWTVALDIMILKRSNGQPLNKEFFIHLFHMVDSDGNGCVDGDELYEALTDAGFHVTKEGLDAMLVIMDEDGDGNISLDEWEKAISVYLDKMKDGNLTIKQKLYGHGLTSQGSDEV